MEIRWVLNRGAGEIKQSFAQVSTRGGVACICRPTRARCARNRISEKFRRPAARGPACKAARPAARPARSRPDKATGAGNFRSPPPAPANALKASSGIPALMSSRSEASRIASPISRATVAPMRTRAKISGLRTIGPSMAITAMPLSMVSRGLLGLLAARWMVPLSKLRAAMAIERSASR